LVGLAITHHRLDSRCSAELNQSLRAPATTSFSTESAHLRRSGGHRRCSDSGRILGAHLVGPHADEVINIFAVAIRQGLTADDLKQMISAYPTAASDLGYMV
jgi:pyruvate/2-oxoglutarate dehydrogenase complex dihydrolipoamide dehydrogenase (E3) component